MTIRAFLLLALSALALGACDKPANESAAIVFEGDWIAFSHRGDWTLEQHAGDEQAQIQLLAPGGARLDITIMPAGDAPDLQAFAKGYPRDDATASFTPVDRPAHLGRLHGYREILQLQGQQVEREYHQVLRNDDTAYLVSTAPAPTPLQAQTGFDLVFTTFRFK